MTHRTGADFGIVRPSDVVPAPWANGLGVTRVLVARHEWRVSLAEIEGRMPFSSFPGADRVLIPVGTDAVTLTINERRHTAAPHTGVAFRGEDTVVAETGDTRISVVNLMWRRSTGRMSWGVQRLDGTVPTDPDAVIVLDGEVLRGDETLPAGTAISRKALLDGVLMRGATVTAFRFIEQPVPGRPDHVGGRA